MTVCLQACNATDSSCSALLEVTGSARCTAVITGGYAWQALALDVIGSSAEVPAAVHATPLPAVPGLACSCSARLAQTAAPGGSARSLEGCWLHSGCPCGVLMWTAYQVLPVRWSCTEALMREHHCIRDSKPIAFQLRGRWAEQQLAAAWQRGCGRNIQQGVT